MVTVETSDLKSVSLYKKRDYLARLDFWPFASLYALAAALYLNYQYENNWDVIERIGIGVISIGILQVGTHLFTYWNVNVKAFIAYQKKSQVKEANYIKVVPNKLSGRPDMVPLMYRTKGKNDQEFSFEYRKKKYYYQEDEDIFEDLEYPVKETFQYYRDIKGYGNETELNRATEKWDLNKFDVPVPKFLSLLQEQMLQPLFCFQVFCVLLWAFDEYWYYSITTLGMLAMFECTVVGQRIRNLSELRNLQVPRQHVQAFRFGKWQLVASEQLIPGDLISITRPVAQPEISNSQASDLVVPADILLIQGSCIVDESMLTGESTPLWKASIGGKEAEVQDQELLGSNIKLEIKKHHQFLLYSGTKIVQHEGPKNASQAKMYKTPDGGCLGVVLRTGFETAQGNLMRTILFSTEKVSANNLETGLFILFLLCFAIAAATYVYIKGIQDPTKSRFKLYLNCAMIITSVIPPELPMELSIAVNNSLIALAQKKIFCTEPFRIPYAGKVDICCFDKTGTLTTDQIILENVAGAEIKKPDIDISKTMGNKSNNGHIRDSKQIKDSLSQELQQENKNDINKVSSKDENEKQKQQQQNGNKQLQQNIVDISQVELKMDAVSKWIISCCHSLVLIDKEMVGDPLEKAAFQRTGSVLKGDTIQTKTHRLLIHNRYHFDAQVKRMSVVFENQTQNKSIQDMSNDESSKLLSSSRYIAACKGAPEVIQKLLKKVPEDYEETYKHYASKGARVIALAYKVIESQNELNFSQLKQLKRDQVESNLVFAGFAIFRTPLKEHSKEAVEQLIFSNHEVIMITGDAALTACHVASELMIISRPCLILQSSQENGAMSSAKVEWSTSDEKVKLEFHNTQQHLLQLAHQYDFCYTGDALNYLERHGLAELAVPLAQVYARVAPEQKELVVSILRKNGRTTLMCGDGTNDVGALKAAHVGVALLAPKPYTKEQLEQRKIQLSQIPKAGQKMIEDMKKRGQKITPRMEQWASYMDKHSQKPPDLNEPQMVKPGDASLASPFTMRSVSIMPSTDIIKQGRCTLITTVQMFKILGLQCLSSAYSLSVMYLDGVKLSDRQAVVQGILTSVMFLFTSTSKPLDRLHPARPHTSIFSPAVFVSLICQFAVHLAFLMYMYQQALIRTPTQDRLNPDSDFKINYVNTVCYLVNMTVQIGTFATNYVGFPFTTPITKNRGLWFSTFYPMLILVTIASGLVLPLNKLMQLEPLPDDLKYTFLILMVGDLTVTFLIDKLLIYLLPAKIPPKKGYESFEKYYRQLEEKSPGLKKNE